jgi:hypothetical protein
LDHSLGEGGEGVKVGGPALHQLQQLRVVAWGQEEGVEHHLVGAAPELRVTGGQYGSQHSQLAKLGKEVHPPLPCRGILLHQSLAAA